MYSLISLKHKEKKVAFPLVRVIRARALIFANFQLARNSQKKTKKHTQTGRVKESLQVGANFY